VSDTTQRKKPGAGGRESDGKTKRENGREGYRERQGKRKKQGKRETSRDCVWVLPVLVEAGRGVAGWCEKERGEERGFVA
jgi:hypothetical protein